jgi:hypothetical protein
MRRYAAPCSANKRILLRLCASNKTGHETPIQSPLRPNRDDEDFVRPPMRESDVHRGT